MYICEKNKPMSKVILKDVDYYMWLKRKFNQKYNFITKKHMSRANVGSCSFLFKKYVPTSYQDFADKYFSDYDNSFNFKTCIGNQHCGRSLEQFNCLVKNYYDEINDKSITLEECFDDLLNHVIIETFDGHIVEKYLMDKLKEVKKFSINENMDYLDAVCGVDISVRDILTNKMVSYLQVKPITTFISDKNLSLVEDRRNFYDKQNKLNNFLIRNGKECDILDIEYICYDKNYKDINDLRFLTINGKHRFKLNELCNLDGTTKLQYNKCVFEKI